MENLVNRLVLLLCSAIIAFAFQNCGKVKFASDGADTLVATEGDGPTGGGGIIDDDLPDDRDDDKDSDDDSKDNGNNNDKDVDGNGHNYICILEGSGQSVHIGYRAGLVSDKNTPEAVCMSKNACEVIAAEVFAVKFAKKKGYCPNKNPHVIEMSDDEVQAGVDLLKDNL